MQVAGRPITQLNLQQNKNHGKTRKMKLLNLDPFRVHYIYMCVCVCVCVCDHF